MFLNFKEAVPKDSFYRKVRQDFAKIEKLIICIIGLCGPCDFIFANLAVNLSNFLAPSSVQRCYL